MAGFMGVQQNLKLRYTVSNNHPPDFSELPDPATYPGGEPFWSFLILEKPWVFKTVNQISQTPTVNFGAYSFSQNRSKWVDVITDKCPHTMQQA